MKVNMRQAQRKTLHGLYSLCWQGDDGVSRSVQAQGKDITASGICVRCDGAIPPGATVFIEGTGGTPGGHGVIRHCTRVGDGYEIGLEFSDEAKASIRTTPEEPDYYEFLQINPKAGQDAIHRIYRFMAARFHPDNPQTGDIEKFILLNRAYDVLSDPPRRSEYDASRTALQTEPDPMFAMGAFVNGIEGEVNRRLAILALLYNKRRINCHDAGLALWDLEQTMAIPREYLDFAVWYLKAKGYLSVGDNSELVLTASGVDYVEANAEKNPTLHKLLSSGARSATGFGTGRENGKPPSREGSYRLEAPRGTILEGRAADVDDEADRTAAQ